MNWIWSNLDTIGELALAHLALSIPAIALAFVLSVPLGWVAHRYRASRGLLLTISGLLYAIPSLALLIILPPLLGTSLRDPVNLVVALTLYGIALMIRTAADGFDAVDGEVLQAADAVGFSPWRRFWRVQLPLAGPVLLSGLRVVIVSTVSLVTIGAVIGVQSLGSLFTDGFQRGIEAEILSGIVLTVVVAVLLDQFVVLAGRLLLPWTATTRTRARRRAGASPLARATVSEGQR